MLDLIKTLSRTLLGLSLATAIGCAQQSHPLNAANPTPSAPTTQSPTKPTFVFDGKVAWDYLLKQVAYGPRVPNTDAQTQCRDWMVQELKKSCDDVRTQHLTHHWSFNGKDLDIYNVIGTQNWKDAKVRMVLLAHWDSRPFADGPNSQWADNYKELHPIPGADDGASGVAVILELAQAIKDKHPGVGICYLLDDGEDVGPQINEMLLGVDYFADHLPDPKPDYGILLDMIGQQDLVVPMEQESYKRAQNLTVAFFKNCQQAGLSKTFPYEIGDDIEDDHLPLLDKGIPTLDLIDFRYYYWHTVDDTAAHCSQSALEQTGDALESFLTKNPPYMPPKG
jgi:hypothetical protein